MSKLYVIYAADEMYNGLHGMNYLDIVVADNLAEAEGAAEEMSLELIQDYNDIMDTFSDDAEAEGYEVGSEEYNSYISESIIDDIYYQVFEITKDTSMDPLELLDKLNEDPIGFIEEYCDKEKSGLEGIDINSLITI